MTALQDGNLDQPLAYIIISCDLNKNLRWSSVILCVRSIHSTGHPLTKSYCVDIYGQSQCASNWNSWLSLKYDNKYNSVDIRYRNPICFVINPVLYQANCVVAIFRGWTVQWPEIMLLFCRPMPRNYPCVVRLFAETDQPTCKLL